LSIKKFLEWKGKTNTFEILFNEKRWKVCFSSSYEEAKTELFLIKGSSWLVEISMNQKNAAKNLGIKTKDKITIRKLK